MQKARGAETGRAWIRLWDLALGVWAASWIVIAVLIATEVRGLADLSRTVITAGAAVERSGEALGSLEQLPIVGEQVAAPAGEVVDAGRQAQASGRSSRRSIRRLSVLLGVAVAVMPSAPLLLYLPWRVQLARERRAVARTLAAAERDDHEALLETLARRAALRLPYRTLRRVSADPWEDIRAGRYEGLARVELRRMGIRGPSRRERVARP